MFHTMIVVTMMFIMPLICFIIEGHKKQYTKKSFFKWFLFWIGGIRALTAGAMQFFNPSYTMNLLQVGQESKIMIMELGAAQFGIGVLGILSLFQERYRTSVAISYGCFLLGASYIHLTRLGHAQWDEIASLAGDVLLVVIVVLYLWYEKSNGRKGMDVRG